MGTFLRHILSYGKRDFKKKRFNFTFFLMFLVLVTTNFSYAQLGTDMFTIASDDVSNYNPQAWIDGSNGGTGFGSWTFSEVNGGSYIGVTGQGSNSFGLFSVEGGINPDNFSFAERAFTRALQPGDTFSADIGHSANIQGEVFVQFLDGTTPVFTLKFVSGGSEWLLNDGGSDFGSGKAYDPNVTIPFSFTYEGNNAYSYTFGSVSQINSMANNSISNITSVRFQSTNQGDNENFGFNNLKIESKYTIPNGESAHVTSNTNVPYLEVESGGSVVVDAGQVLTAEGGVTNEGSITFKSDNTGTAQFDEYTGTISGSGSVTVERFIPAGDDESRGYRLLTSAVNSTQSINANWQEGATSEDPTPNPNPTFGTHITGGEIADGFDQNETDFASMFTFNNDFEATGSETQSDAWTALPNTNVKTLKAGEGYLTFIRGDRSVDLSNVNTPPTNTTLRATGTLHTGAKEFSSVNNSTTPEYGLSDIEDYFSLVGNPYQAIVDITELVIDNVNAHYWIWDPTLKNYTTVDFSDHNDVTTSNGSPANQFIQPGQSFFVQTIANAPASLTFNEDDKDVTGVATAVFSQESRPSLKLLLYKTSAYNAGEREVDGTLIKFSENGNNDLDLFDADKLQGSAESLARLQDNELISIEHRAMPTDEDLLQFATTGYTASNYTFVVNAHNIDANFDTYLRDNYTGIQTQLNEGATAVSFAIDANIPESIAEDRFSIVFENTTLEVNDNSFGTGFSLYPNPSTNGQFSIKTPNLSGEVNLEISNLLGQQLLNQNLAIEEQEVKVNAEHMPSGIYLVKLTQGKQGRSFKLIVK